VQNSYYLIRQLVPHLKEKIVGSALSDCYSQNKDELILQLTNAKADEFTIIAHLNPQFTCLAFPDSYSKAKRNAAAIFNPLKELKVLDVEGFENERAFVVQFENNYSLLFKLFGQQSNILLFKNDNVEDLFRSSLKNDSSIKLNSLDRPLNQSKEAIIEALPKLGTVYPTLNRQARTYLENEINNLSDEQAYKKVHEFISDLENPSAYYSIDDDGRIKFSLTPTENIIAEYTNPLEALTEFFKLYLKTNTYSTMRRKLMKEFKQKFAKSSAYIAKTNRKKDDLGNKTSQREIADLIMANLHSIKPNTSSVDLLNFYTNENVTVKLNPRISAQLNAEKYYKKAKNVSIEISKLEEAVASKEVLLKKLQREIKKVENSSSISDLREFIKEKKAREPTKATPFKQFDIDGFTVLVGNNAKQNDLLTLKYAKKEDLFFHAKDVSGSHVILKQISGRDIPKYTLEKTAAIAAYYSKKKTDSLCPVGFTPKKYVRKPKGAAPGLVLVEREKVLLVKPELPK